MEGVNNYSYLFAVVGCGFWCIHSLWGLRMERASLHLHLYVILFTASLSVRSAANIFMKCVRGKFDPKASYLLKYISWFHLTAKHCSVTTPFKKARDFALWLWSAHNEVNERLMKEEAHLKTGDPKFPKIIWPPKQLCPSCHHSQVKGSNQIDWDRDEVFKFLLSYYGNTLISLYKEKGLLADDGTKATLDDLVASTNAVVVPVGAALAIALASCAFGALACYWRSHQKNRKYYHQLHSLKNI